MVCLIGNSKGLEIYLEAKSVEIKRKRELFD